MNFSDKAPSCCSVTSAPSESICIKKEKGTWLLKSPTMKAAWHFSTGEQFKYLITISGQEHLSWILASQLKLNLVVPVCLVAQSLSFRVRGGMCAITALLQLLAHLGKSSCYSSDSCRGQRAVDPCHRFSDLPVTHLLSFSRDKEWDFHEWLFEEPRKRVPLSSGYGCHCWFPVLYAFSPCLFLFIGGLTLFKFYPKGKGLLPSGGRWLIPSPVPFLMVIKMHSGRLDQGNPIRNFRRAF